MTRINHNIESMISQYALSQADSGLKNAITQLSTGLRINTASDDPSNYEVSEQLTAQVRGSVVATRNSEDANSLMQIADGAMGQVSQILQRMRELSVESSNDTFNSTDRAYMNQEFQGLKAEVDRIAGSTEYNGMQLLSGSVGSFGSVGGPSVIQVGANNKVGIDTISVSMGSITTGALSLVTAGVDSQTNATASIVEIDAAISKVDQQRSYMGALMNRFTIAESNLTTAQTNSQAAESVITDVDFAKMTTELTKYQILTQASTAMLSQANNLPQSVLQLFSASK